MSDIPPEIVTNFLSRVPEHSLLRFRCVSKSWLGIIDSQDFIKMHLNRTIRTNSDRKLIIHSRYIHMADFDSLEMTNKSDYLELDHPFKHPNKATEILGSCHGLVCLKNGKDILLWNPTTRNHFKLPFSMFEFPKKKSMYCTRSIVYGFGYDRVSDDYKVLGILWSYDSKSEVKVFSMKSKSWRKLPYFPYRLKYARDHAVLARGALHWFINRNQDSEMVNLIASFDLGTEQYRLVPLPDDLNKEFYMGVGVLGESLCLMSSGCYNNSKCVDIWVMKKYAMEESWTKLVTVTESDFEGKPFHYVMPVAYSTNGRRVLMAENSKLPLWYDLKNRKIRYSKFSISCSPNFMEHYMCFGSLVQFDGGVSDSVWRVVDRKN